MWASVLAASCLTAQVQALPQTDLAATVSQLVDRLDDDDVARRQQAEKDLIALGPAALDHLPTADPPSAEAKARLTRVRNQLERDAAVAATRGSTVSLRGEMTLTEALASLERQTGNRFLDYRDRFGQHQSDPKLHFDFHEANYWEVVDHLLDQAQLRLYSYTGQPHTLAFVARQPGQLAVQGRVWYGGLFRGEATRIEAARDLGNADNQTLKLSLVIAWEPRTHPIAIIQPLESITAIDEHANPILTDNRQSTLEVPAQATVGAVEMDIPLRLPARDVQKIASFRGTIQAVLPGRQVLFRFDNLQTARTVTERNAGATVVLEAVRKNADLYEVRIRVGFDDASGALESHRGWIYNNEAYLLDAQGNRIDHAGFETTAQRRDEVGLSYKFVVEGNLAGHSFLYKTPAAIVRVPVEYELKDIALP